MLGVKRVSVNYLRQMMFMALVFSPFVAAEPNILFSNKPVALFYASVTSTTLSDEQVLFPDDRNMHDYQLSVVDLKKLNRADVIFWLGPTSEPQLAKLKQRFTQKQWIALADTEHAWLSWRGMQQMLKNLQKSAYGKPRENISEQLLSLKSRYEKELSRFSGQKFLLGHAAFEQYFAELGLTGAVLYSAGHSHGHHGMGEKERLGVQKLLASGEIRCAIEEPDVHFDGLSRRFAGLKLIRLEPMATSFRLVPSSFLAFHQYNLQQLLGCLKG